MANQSHGVSGGGKTQNIIKKYRAGREYTLNIPDGLSHDKLQPDLIASNLISLLRNLISVPL